MADPDSIVLDTLLAHRSIRRFTTDPVADEDPDRDPPCARAASG